MPSYLQIENISKSYGPKVLFQNIDFNINEGDKVALIAPNGTGKTSLLRILAGKDSSDSGGKVLFLKDIRIAFLEQEYKYNPDRSIFDQIMDDSHQWTDHLETDQLWKYELRVNQLLTQFGLDNPDKPMRDLSGGEVKRVALTRMLASEADFYIMDEPTNHLDIDAIEFLESHLKHSRCTLFMVTHDRYFLDRVCNTVMEMDRGGIYIYKGDYMNFLEKRQERIDNYNAETERVRNIYRRELEWMHASPCARTGKAKYRKQAFWDIKERADDSYIQKKVDLSETQIKNTYLGNKVINCKDVSFFWEGKCYLNHFSYNFQRYEKVGIVGRNAAGKTTFLNLITGQWKPEMGGRLEGVIDLGDSLKIGYYHQSGMQFKPGQTVLETVNDTHLLSRFLFTHDMLQNPVERLSGGERRRLYLLTILLQQPNFLVLDEPTNDLDIVTLEILEEYLQEYKGSLVIVSHDRHFLDRLVDHLFVFCGDGVVKDFVGNYTEYRTFIKDYEAQQKKMADQVGHDAKGAKKMADQVGHDAKGAKKMADQVGHDGMGKAVMPGSDRASVKRKLSYKEQQELKSLEEKLPQLEAEKADLEAKLSSGMLGMDELQQASARYGTLKDELDAAEMRWLELQENL
ncbi:MAG: ABC-F family ATP-binding cassette domain-containing protein [Bacteroidales bacterium]|nr:ABC-F family ATP-binding cassette domain-containing protein [Bacteroidales bacterium]